ncbi:MAG TPA: hypothetical protein VGW58_12500 [Pyrinomonadaceae bacterium]|nr:hypothetical protein [Pyrinomonadaceae bacterium]
MGRIVVNFERSGKPPGHKRKSRRWARILLVLTIILVAIVGLAAVGGFFWWRHYQSTPAYSLALLVDAAERNDKEQLAKLIDDDQIAMNMISQVSQKAAARYGGSNNATTQQQLEKLVPPLLPRLKQTIQDEAADGIRSFATPLKTKHFVVLLFTLPSLVKLSTNGDTATAATMAVDSSIKLSMRRDADRWKVVAFDSEVMVQRLVDAVMKELPAIGALDKSDPLLRIPRKPRKRRR